MEHSAWFGQDAIGRNQRTGRFTDMVRGKSKALVIQPAAAQKSVVAKAVGARRATVTRLAHTTMIEVYCPICRSRRSIPRDVDLDPPGAARMDLLCLKCEPGPVTLPIYRDGRGRKMA